jgi:hypothetical protein
VVRGEICEVVSVSGRRGEVAVSGGNCARNFWAARCAPIATYAIAEKRFLPPAFCGGVGGGMQPPPLTVLAYSAAVESDTPRSASPGTAAASGMLAGACR